MTCILFVAQQIPRVKNFVHKKRCLIDYTAYFSPTSFFNGMSVKGSTKENAPYTFNIKVNSLCAFSLIIAYTDFPQPPYTIDFAGKGASML